MVLRGERRRAGGRRRRFDDRPLSAAPRRREAHGLDDLTLDLLGHENISITELIGKGKKQMTMDKVRTASVRDYAGEDADAAWQLAERCSNPSWTRKGFRELYDKLEVPLIEVLAEMEFNGIRARRAVPEQARRGDGGRTRRHSRRTIHALAGREFNIASLKQLRKVLFDETETAGAEADRHQERAEHRPGVARTARRARPRLAEEAHRSTGK